ncbi:hypothetical protein JCM4914_21730 [Streptomyces platensis subsp. malvinus]
MRPTPVRVRQLSTTGPLSTVPDQDPHGRPDCVTVDPCDSNDSHSSRGEGPRHSNDTFDERGPWRHGREGRHDRQNTIDRTTYDEIDHTASGSATVARAGTCRTAAVTTPQHHCPALGGSSASADDDRLGRR